MGRVCRGLNPRRYSEAVHRRAITLLRNIHPLLMERTE